MLIANILKKIALFPVWLILLFVGLIISAAVHVLSFCHGILSFGLTLLILGTAICYHDWRQVLFLLVLMGILYLILAAGVFIDELVAFARRMILL